ncbi:unnamed protein product [Acanthoscelides obtectus]|uniref:Uncharacterized protein n=1 Tax=Acanthoscelides obtectus TaxID=200917 RepID=A0A9P0K4N6_ACAOB|nr:unnamed protein product [Acanthoscelides obtectus]CAK1639457.1 hypothetical protein AOBTE_LOCUS11187 [Acanthoscelides obtectus]
MQSLQVLQSRTLRKNCNAPCFLWGSTQSLHRMQFNNKYRNHMLLLLHIRR